jgi:hypothetical protein
MTVGVQRKPEPSDLGWSPTLRDWGDLLASLQRVAIALEQHTLAMLDNPSPLAELGYTELEPDQLPPPPPGVVTQAPQAHAAPVTVAPQALVCPIHKKPFRDGKYGWYCPSKLDDDSWCRQKP